MRLLRFARNDRDSEMLDQFSIVVPVVNESPHSKNSDPFSRVACG